MDAFVIQGRTRLSGRVRVHGSKNAALPMMAAALLTGDTVTLRDVPCLADVDNLLRLLHELGCHEVDDPGSPGERRQGERRLRVTDERESHAPYEIVRTMRASICVLGPMLGRRGFARVSLPGGCQIGDRPVDLHLRGLAALGAQITLDGGDIVARAPTGGLRGASIFMGGPFGSTVTGTINVLCAATLAKGVTVIEGAACEPEVVDLARLLTSMGARITGAGSPRLEIEGVRELGGAQHTVMPDRIEAGTLACAAAITNGELILENCPLDAMMATCAALSQAGVHVERIDNGADAMRATARVTSERTLRPVEVTTQPHPGFPTDLQAQLLALLSLADGNSVVTEKIYPERFVHVAELSRMGARLLRHGSTVVVSGVRNLVGARVMASDLRASASLVLAGMAAEGTTIVDRVYHLDRGYERLDERLRAAGANIKRVDDKDLATTGRR